MNMPKYKKITDVQQTWKEHGWTPPGEDPKIKSKWMFYKTLNTELDTERAFDVYLPQEQQHG
jgi:hypothetical protein